MKSYNFRKNTKKIKDLKEKKVKRRKLAAAFEELLKCMIESDADANGLISKEEFKAALEKVGITFLGQYS